jgi:hypothetical protein
VRDAEIPGIENRQRRCARDRLGRGALAISPIFCDNYFSVFDTVSQQALTHAWSECDDSVGMSSGAIQYPLEKACESCCRAQRIGIYGDIGIKVHFPENMT